MTDKTKPTLTQDIMSFYHTGRSPCAPVLSNWVDRANALEDQLSGTALRAKNFEIECLNKAGAIDELLKQRDEARDDLANKQNIVDNNRKIIDALRQTQTHLERERDEAREELRVSKLETLAALGTKRDADTAWQRETDQLKESNTAWEAQCNRLQNIVAGLRTELDTAYQQTMPRQLGGTGTIHTKASSGCGGIAATPQSMEVLATEAARKALADGSWKQVPELCNIVATIAHKLINGTTK